MRKALLLGVTAVAAATAALGSAPAEATSVTFTLSGGALSVAQPSGTASITGGGLAGLAGSAITGTLGSTTVTDSRGGITGWSSTIAQTTPFTNGTTTIPAANTKAWIPALSISTTGVSLVSSGLYLTQLTGLSLTSSPQTLVTATGVLGNNTATFNPSIAVTVPGDATAGDYTGVITQTVS